QPLNPYTPILKIVLKSMLLPISHDYFLRRPPAMAARVTTSDDLAEQCELALANRARPDLIGFASYRIEIALG
ncbi:hypothetical protein, partial [Pseudomonas putida]|uniref:hypothetical protein n=1 Tax=Pseudomonas putida TaxID=303 RepID=UPI002363BBC5